ncbi:YkoF family thiamine/hydroxymethylpyrimidine-binding protein [Oceanobacter mangrovi]|uniref:YkoF family thiamine/hydroxymethylpyrimidine-binding protein n=1 Tax=Oceanobacter mangrovi TaxID=2862510 RepID=UPI001C8E1CA2|nr:YkoF family thiamine/hydroxymethylpyrimidine-binding protein [Oceanobacter mangrovi]
MQLSVDISAYPLADDYIPAIKTFIERLQQTQGLTVVCNTMSTQVFGDYDLVMSVLAAEMKLSFETFGKAIFVYKMIPGTNLDPALKPHG